MSPALLSDSVSVVGEDVATGVPAEADCSEVEGLGSKSNPLLPSALSPTP